MENLVDTIKEEKNQIRTPFGNEQQIIQFWVYWNKNKPTIYTKKKKNTDHVEIVFKKLTNDIWNFIESKIIEFENDPLMRTEIPMYNFMKLKLYTLKYLLKEWNLNIPLNRENDGGLNSKTFDRVLSIHPYILRHVLSQIEKYLFINEEDNYTIVKQCNAFFSTKRNAKVNNPHEAILNYQKLNVFWSEFGLNHFDLQNMPHDLFLQLSTVVREKINVNNREMASNNHAPKSNGKDKFNKSMSLI